MKQSLIGLSLVAVACSGLLACSSDEGSSTSSSSSGSTGTLYERLGGNAGIKKAVDAIVTDLAADPIIVTYFAGGDPKPTLALTVPEIKECLVLQLGEASGGPEKYATPISTGKTCRSMTTSHASLNINAATFDKFVGIAAATLKKAGVADADITTIGGVLNSTKTQVVTDTAAGDAKKFAPK